MGPSSSPCAGSLRPTCSQRAWRPTHEAFGFRLGVDGILAAARLLERCAWFRHGPAEGERNLVLVSYSHESDGATQALSHRVIQRFGRAPKQLLPTQQGTFHLRLMRISKATGEAIQEVVLKESWQCRSTVVLEKTAAFAMEAMARMFPFSIGDSGILTKWADLLDKACDRLVVDQHSDKVSGNLVALKHIACTISGAVVRSVQDASACELHIIHNLKVTGPNVRHDVGKLYSLRSICRVGSFHYALVHCIAHACHSSIRRIVGPPPVPANNSDMCLLIEAFFGAVAEHQGARSRQSQLREDLAALAAIPLYELPGQRANPPVRIHYCWDPSTEGPCCASEDESQEKAVLAHEFFRQQGVRGRFACSIYKHQQGKETGAARSGGPAVVPKRGGIRRRQEHR